MDSSLFTKRKKTEREGERERKKRSVHKHKRGHTTKNNKLQLFWLHMNLTRKPRKTDIHTESYTSNQTFAQPTRSILNP